MHSLHLQANPQGWRLFIARQQEDAFKKTARVVFERDDFQCYYCAIQMPHAQEVININGHYDQNELSNLTTACGFCAQCRFLDSVGGNGYGGGTLIYLPELSQEKLNAFCYALFKAVITEAEESETAQQYYRSLNKRAQLVEDQLGTGMSEPSIFGQLLVESGLKIKMDSLMMHLKLLPSRASFKNQIATWLASLK